MRSGTGPQGVFQPGTEIPGQRWRVGRGASQSGDNGGAKVAVNPVKARAGANAAKQERGFSGA